MTLVRRRRAAGLDAAMLHFAAFGCHALASSSADPLAIWGISRDRAGLAAIWEAHGPAIRAAAGHERPWIERRLALRDPLADSGAFILCSEHDGDNVDGDEEEKTS